VEQRIQRRGESDDSSEGRGSFVGSESGAFVCFETLEDGFGTMPLSVNVRVERPGLILQFGETVTWNGAGGGSLFKECLAEG
jgi:hypothetical protein